MENTVFCQNLEAIFILENSFFLPNILFRRLLSKKSDKQSNQKNKINIALKICLTELRRKVFTSILPQATLTTILTRLKFTLNLVVELTQVLFQVT